MSKPTLISATPSPYARKVRITLQEKAIPFTLQTEVPWDSTTATPSYNPLEKLPVLILDNAEKTSVYESSYILEYIEYKMKGNGWKAMSDDVDERLLEKKVDVTCTAVMDALVLVFFERQREQKSVEWEARQLRKVKGGLGQVAEWVGDKEFIVGNRFGLADIAAGSLLGYVDVRFKEYPWRTTHPNLAKYYDALAERQSFKDTVPYPQTIKDKIV